ncbi:MAG TPA: histidine kinase [Bryobacteraceae bacterium]|nr:histidine kinase [Bryobacteraceae bacterium]
MSDPSTSLAKSLVTLLRAREGEYERVSRLLHDEIGQVLSAVGLQLDVLRLDYKDQLPEIAARTAEIQNLLERAMKQVRDLSYLLNPAIVERAGLHSALDRLVGRSRALFPGPIRLLLDSSVRIPPDVGTAFYRIAEQAIENAVQHSGATLIEVLLKPARNAASLEIRDNGTGFSPDAHDGENGLGLALMHYYAEQKNLEFKIRTGADEGTIISVLYVPNELTQRL